MLQNIRPRRRPAVYVHQRSTVHVLRTGDVVRVRQLRRDEHRPVLEVFEGLSARSRFFRYHAPTPRLTTGNVLALTDVDADRHVAVVAAAAGRSVGIARWIREPDPRAAELAVEVVDEWQGRGVGRRLVEHIGVLALEAGVTRFTCHVHPENDALRVLLRRLGARSTSGPSSALSLAVGSLVGSLDGESGRLDGSMPSCRSGCSDHSA